MFFMTDDELKLFEPGAIDMETTAYNKKIEKELIMLHQFLEQAYSREAHFTFVGYFDICSRLFKMDFHKKKKFQETSEHLKNSHGSYMLKIPDVL